MVGQSCSLIAPFTRAQEEELRRVIPVIRGIRERSSVPISIDTYRSEVCCQPVVLCVLLLLSLRQSLGGVSVVLASALSSSVVNVVARCFIFRFPQVARQAVQAGANIVNDVSGACKSHYFAQEAVLANVADCWLLPTLPTLHARCWLRAAPWLAGCSSGGLYDAGMFAAVRDLCVPYVLMHLRGDPRDMQSLQHTAYTDVVA
jgi:dihydropteroate synthase